MRLGGNVVGADASPDNIKMAKLHAQKDPALWRGPGHLDYRHTTAGKEERIQGHVYLLFTNVILLFVSRGSTGGE